MFLIKIIQNCHLGAKSHHFQTHPWWTPWRSKPPRSFWLEIPSGSMSRFACWSPKMCDGEILSVCCWNHQILLGLDPYFAILVGLYSVIIPSGLYPYFAKHLLKKSQCFVPLRRLCQAADQHRAHSAASAALLRHRHSGQTVGHQLPVPGSL